MSNIKVEFNKKNVNPFYGLTNCLTLFQNQSGIINSKMLDAAYDEVKDNLEKRQMFFSLLFAIGDITARQHNIFKGKTRDSGGNANREGFFVALNWLIDNHFDQFEAFLNAGLFNEYTCFDHLFRNRLKTSKTSILAAYNMFENKRYCKALAEYCYKVINSNDPFTKTLIAKFLSLPRLSPRKGHKQMLPSTKKLMKDKIYFLQLLSDLMNWDYQVSGNYVNFIGYREWRKEYNVDFESVMFSTRKIFEFDKENFLKWYGQLSSQARFRTKNRIQYRKIENSWYYEKFQPWIKEWELSKEKAQQDQRELEEKIRQGNASLDDVEKLKQVKKEAKVNIGATNFKELFDDILRNRIDKLKLESFINKVNLPYNSLVIIDDSGSMHGEPFDFAKFMATVCLTKNPDDTGRNLLGFFSNTARLFAYKDMTSKRPNALINPTISKTLVNPLIDPLKSFYDNYNELSRFCDTVFQGGGTDLSCIPENFSVTAKKNPEILEALRNFPIWTIISDGDVNQQANNTASMTDFFRKCENLLGFKPFLIIININNYCRPNANVFSGIENMIIIDNNPAQIEQVLTNFKDMDVFDVYMPLQSLFKSNRYDLIRNLVR